MSEQDRLLLPETPGRAQRQPISLTWRNLCYSVDVKTGKLFSRRTERKTILNQVSGVVRPGQLLAIMGSSGAGKSTMLDILAQRKNTGTVSGELHVNGKPPTRLFKRFTGYVTQDDCLPTFQTVRETLMFYANLKLPTTITSAQKQRLVDDLIAELGLENVRDSKIGSQFIRGISGGERKRVSIGSEMITNPGLLFLDEPTTGLDAFNSFAVMDQLNRMAKKGRTVVCTIHQPRSTIFELFDQLMILSHGEVVYFGPASETLSYFAALSFRCRDHLNPADFFIDVVIQNDRRLQEEEANALTLGTTPVRSGSTDGKGSGEVTEDVEAPAAEPVDFPDAFRSSVYFDRLERDIREVEDKSRSIVLGTEYVSEYASNVFRQIWFVSIRTWQNLIRNPLATYAALFQVLFMALLVGTIYFDVGNGPSSIQDRQGALFFMITNQAFSQFAGLNVYLAERDQVNRERAGNTYRTSAYFFAKTIIEMPFFLIYPAIFSCVAYFMVGLQAHASNFFIFLGTLILFTSVASSLFLALGAVSPNQELSQIIAPVITVIFLLFGGFYVNSDSIPVYYQWLAYCSFFKYGYEIVMVNEFDGLGFNCDGAPACVDTGKQVLEAFGMQDVVIWHNVLILVGMLLIYRVIVYLCVRFLYLEKR